MKILMMPLGLYQTNCYVLYNEDSFEAVVIDPGSDGDSLLKALQERQLKVQKILLTHGHSDHIGAVQAVADAYHAPVYIHKKEAPFLHDPVLNLSAKMGLSITCDVDEIHVQQGTVIEVADMSFTVLETPGHTPGGICFYGEGLVFAGDTLFQDSIGRTDFPGGSYETLIQSIQTQLYTLPQDTVVCPGHGPTTSLEYEMKNNPFVRG